MAIAKGVGGILSFLIIVVFSTFLMWYFFNEQNPMVILAVSIFILLLARSFLPAMVYEFEEFERGVVFRFGRFNRVVGPGWVFLIPFIETFTQVDLRISTIDTKPQPVITKDSINLEMDAVAYVRVTNPAKVVMNVKDYKEATVTYVKAQMRDVIGKLTLDDIIGNIEKVNSLLREGLQEMARDWGVNIVKVEIQTVELPSTVKKAMDSRKASQQERLATEQRAQAREIMINAIQRSASKLSDPSLAYLYLESLKQIAEGKSTKIIFPIELTRLAEGLVQKVERKEGAPEAKSKPAQVKADYSAVLNDLVKQYQDMYKKYAEKSKKLPSKKKEDLTEA